MAKLELEERLSLNYTVLGQGQRSLLLLNGAGLPLEFWGDLPTLLAKDYHVIQMDQRNAGHSEYTGSFTLNDVAADVASLLAHLEVERVTIVGHAWGARVAQVFARDYPHLCEALVICCNGGHFPPADTGDTQDKMRDAMRAGDRQTWEAKLAIQFCGDGFPDREPAVFKSMADVIWQHRPNNRARWNPQVSPPSSYWGLATMPALLIYGDEDKNGTIENAEHLHARLKESQLHILKGCGHFAIREKEQEVISLIREFLSKLS
jgi:3-oxoadipate enol-lactonase